MRLLTLALLFLAPVATLRAQQPTAELDAAFRELIEAAELPGFSVAVVRHGRLAWSGALGVRDADTGAPVTGRTVFEAASLSKPVFAYIALRLADRGVLDLDRPLHEYRSNPRIGHDDRARAITARMVLTHSTGLPNWGGDTLDLAFDPGTGFAYSGEGYVYLQEVVEALAGTELDELARREVFEPLGMDRSAFVWHDRLGDDAAAPHDVLDRPLPLRKRETANAAASLVTTAEDYATFVAAVLAGEGLEPETAAAMLSPGIAAPSLQWSEAADPRIHWGLGWGLTRGDEEATIWHWGDNGPFKAFVAAYPDRGDAVVYFANSQRGLSVAEATTRIGLGVAHPAVRWVGHDQYDDPPVVARRQLFDAFVDHGADAGLRRYQELRARQPEMDGPRLVADVAGLLRTVDRMDAAVVLLEHARSLHDDPDLAETLAMAYLAVDRLRDAATLLGDLAAAAEGSDDAEQYRRGIEWIQPLLLARQHPVHIPEDSLRSLAGEYGPRTLDVEEGALFYQRDGNPRYRLEPLGHGLFQPRGLDTFRIRLESGPDGRPAAIIGLYLDGSRDRSERTAPEE